MLVSFSEVHQSNCISCMLHIFIYIYIYIHDIRHKLLVSLVVDNFVTMCPLSLHPTCGITRNHRQARHVAYPLVNIQKAVQHGHRNSGFSH